MTIKPAMYDHCVIDYPQTAYKIAPDMTVENTPAGEYAAAYTFYESKLTVKPDFKPRAPRTSIVPAFIDNEPCTRWIKATRKSDGCTYWISRRTTKIKTFKLEVEMMGFDVAMERAEARCNYWLVQRDQPETSFVACECTTEEICKTFSSVRDAQGRVFFADAQKSRQLSSAYSYTSNR